MNPIYLQTENEKVNQVFRIALGDLFGNIRLFQDGLLTTPSPVVLAGLEYDTPWTRDAAINVWNGAGLLFPEEAKNTLLSVLIRDENGVRIGGQYWDAIIWAEGAWQYYLYTKDHDFLSLACESVKNSLAFFERTEYNLKYELFSGPACYGDGIAAYGDEFSSHNEGNSGITHWWECNQDKLEKELTAKGGIGMPLYTLSTNCLYYRAYELAEKMETELHLKSCGCESDSRSFPETPFKKMAQKLRASINHHFWMEKEGTYAYYLASWPEEHLCTSQEALGLAFALLFHIADERQTELIFQNCHIAPAGIPCVWPSFSRYDTSDGQGFGRHSGTVWPHAQGFWADAAAKAGKFPAFFHEFYTLTDHVYRDWQFSEIYHPIDGRIYGGRQEGDGPIFEWHSCNRQTWSATAYIRMVLLDLCGMHFTPEGIYFSPVLDEKLGSLSLREFYYGQSKISLTICGTGANIRSFSINGIAQEQPFLPASSTGEISIHITLEA